MKQEWVKKWQTGERTQSLKVAASTQSQSPKPSRNLCPTWLDWFFKSQKSGLRHEISRFFHVGNSLKFKLHDKQNTCVRGNHRLGLQLGTCASKLSLPLHTQLRPAAQWEAVLSLLRLPGWHRTFFQDEQEGGFHWPGGTSRLTIWMTWSPLAQMFSGVSPYARSPASCSDTLSVSVFVHMEPPRVLRVESFSYCVIFFGPNG